MSETWFYHISQAGKLTQVATVGAALAAAKDGGSVWLNYCQTTKEELSNLIDPLGLHPLAIEDCFDENEIPKIEDFQTNTFILFNCFDYSNKELRSARSICLSATTFVPLTLLAGIGGMSEWSMMTRPENWRIAYPAFLLVLVVIGFGNYYLIKWLEKRSRTPDRRTMG
jgi:Mg2+ and Co2+ transporter CorA